LEYTTNSEIWQFRIEMLPDHGLHPKKGLDQFRLSQILPFHLTQSSEDYEYFTQGGENGTL